MQPKRHNLAVVDVVLSVASELPRLDSLSLINSLFHFAKRVFLLW
jgi:hypothetical protein